LTYGQYIEQYITQQPLAAPIYTADISRILADAFQMKPDKASSATAVAMKRLMGRRTIPALRFYQNGIYYRTSVTPFGEMGIDKEQLIAHKYLNADQGYDTGAGLLYRMGLTTQLPNERLIATNAAQDCVRRDEKLNVSICPPKTRITAENKAYLQMLDAMEQMERAPIDAEKPYRVLAEHIQHRKLQYGVLLALAGAVLSPTNTAAFGSHGHGRRAAVMKLHLDSAAFRVLIDAIHQKTGYREDVLEKDYYRH